MASLFGSMLSHTMKSRFPTGLAILSTVAAMITVCYTLSFLLRFPGNRGPVYETWESSSEVFKVRLTAYREVGIYMPGAFYSFESAPAGSDEWTEVKELRGDDAIPLNQFKERTSFVDSHTAYFYTWDEFFVTRDGGCNWSRWVALVPESDGTLVGWSIRKARVESNGTGRAKLWRYDDQQKGEVEREVFTPDFGQNWYPIVGQRDTFKAR